jgi:hypothetical protein
MSNQYQQMKGRVMFGALDKQDTKMTQDQASKMLSEASYASSLWGYAGAGLAVGTFLLSGGTSVPLMAGIGGLGSLAGSEIGEFKSLAEADPIVGAGEDWFRSDVKSEAKDVVEDELDAQQLSQAVSTTSAIYSVGSALDPSVLNIVDAEGKVTGGKYALENLLDFDELLMGAGDNLDDFFNFFKSSPKVIESSSSYTPPTWWPKI